VIGRFPFVARLRDQVGDLAVFEREKVRQPGEYGSGDMARILPRADVVAITSTTIVNHTLAAILGLVTKEALVLLLGPSTPFAEELFGQGVDVLCGSLVADADKVLRAASQGGVTRQIRAVRRVAWWRDGSVRPGCDGG
jgi:uncharacterized protein (DUF4213/DUF364 family)